MAPSSRRTYGLLLCSIVAVALATRLGTLQWSPLPSTLDGFLYVSRALETIETGTFPLRRFRADSFVFTSLLTVLGIVTAASPLYIAQPTVAITGAVSCLVAIALTRRLTSRYGWSRRRTALAIGIVGFGLALDGLYVRRSGVTDEEALAFLLIPLLAIAVFRAFSGTGRTQRWYTISGVLLAAFPLLHTFSSLLAGLVLTGVFAACLVRTPRLKTVVAPTAIVLGFWCYVGLYYRFAEQTILLVPYVDRVTAYPGLFVAWIILLMAGIVWVQRTGATLQRAVIGTVVGVWFIALAANITQSVFPGLQTTPPVLSLITLGFAVPVIFGLIGLPIVSWEPTHSPPVLALFFAPIVVVYFALTAALTPEYYDTALRGQTFAHFGLFICAAIGVGLIVARRTSTESSTTNVSTTTPATDGGVTLRRGLTIVVVGLILLSTALTLPLAFLHIDTATGPAVTTQAQFAGATFTAERTTQTWATDDPLGRVGSHMRPAGTNNSQRPVTEWLRGGQPPACPTLVQQSWAEEGAHLFPAPAEQIDSGAFETWQAENNVVYSARDINSVLLVQPRSTRNQTAC